MTTDVLEDTKTSDPELVDENPKVAHIIGNETGATADAIITQAHVEGTPLTALCGVIFIPSQDPKSLPVCKLCRRVFSDIMEFRAKLA